MTRAVFWVGWFGFNGGSALAADQGAGMAILATHISAATAGLVWMSLEWMRFGRPSMIGTVTGVVAGLATVAPASGYVSPVGGLILGVCIKPWDISILPDGTNLPAGSGTAEKGAKIYVEKGCNACHGEGAKGGSNPALNTDKPLVDNGIEAAKTIKNFWGHPTTIFDYVCCAMPWPAPRTLTDDEVYSLVAYILAGNKLIDEKTVIDAKTLPQVKIPNRDNFIIRFPDRI